MRRPFRARRSLGLSATSQHEHAMRGPAARVAAGIDDTQESSLYTLSLFSHRFEQDLDQASYKRLRTLDF
jgi:hypothetical protein